MTHPRRRLPPERRRSEILAAALEVFAERGYRGASLAAVAERVGLTQQGLLHYFPSKDALLAEVLRLRDDLDRHAYPDDCGLDALEKVVAHNTARPGLVQSFTVLAADSVTDEHPAKPFFTERYRAVRAVMAEAVRRDLGDDLPAGLTHEQAGALLVAVMDGLQLQWLLDPDEVRMTDAFRAFVALLRR
ncbi:TetR family transcriptional regulator [Catellatospora sp. TT07R-123]|uniref:TetR/AcrR family transcriptional regulator n=1 Tax=Catellatospora sp. TT07R-123 TaxID=2733863 RepID=UPI001B175A90|nr:TetR/AcrR family transcriptional regulator [Catellatospora sp. TT07R-123]GHJ49279.1 TetR family transcriptional regulator [Catellatospora sp. TT07R-123]